MKLSKFFFSYIFLGFSLAGAILPTLANIDFMMIYGPAFDVKEFISLANANPAAQSLSRDLFIAASAFTLWIFVEARRLEMRNLWIVILLTFLVSFACAAPLFLSLRERRIIEIEEQSNNF